MSKWKLTTLEKKCWTEVQIWRNKDGLEAKHEIGWRWGWVRYSTKPDLSSYDDKDYEQVEVSSLGEVDDMEQDDGCSDFWYWPDELDEDERDRLSEIYDENWDEGLNEEGWEEWEREFYICGPVELKQEIEYYLESAEPAVKVETWIKDDLIVEHRTKHKGRVLFNSEPDISGYDPNEQLDIRQLEQMYPRPSLVDNTVIEEEWEFPEDMPKKEQNWFKKNKWEKYTEAGWESQDDQIWLTGELILIKDEEE